MSKLLRRDSKAFKEFRANWGYKAVKGLLVVKVFRV